MGEAKRRRERLKSMTEEEKRKAYVDLIKVTSARMAALAAFYLANGEQGLGLNALLQEVYNQTQFNFATVSALATILKEKVGIDLDDLMKLTLKNAEDKLSEAEAMFNIDIQPGRVTPKGEPS